MSHPRTPERKFTMDEVARHNTEADCWFVIKGRVYDASDWIADHPGGRAIVAVAGRDATDIFTCFHSTAAWKELAARCIGEVASPEPVSELVRDFRQLRLKMQRQGLFDSNKAYYAYKVATNAAILAVSVALLAFGRHSLSAVTLSALLLGLFWQQSGWLAHDFCHHQVFKRRRFNDAMGYVLGNVCQGFSVDWWKSKHNLHHAAPNELTASKRAIDPDIDTLPLFAWSDEMLETARRDAKLGLVRIQHYLFLPVLMIARFNWAIGSFLHALRMAKGSSKGKFELSLLAVHYGWHFGIAVAFLPIPEAILYAGLSQVFSGALLAIVFVQGHNGREVFSAPKDFVRSQVSATRDMDASLWNDWFSGGLNYQIEHHLFPSLPRHNLGKARKPVVELCEKHGLVFEECGMAEGTRRVLRCLAAIAAQA